VTARFSSFHNTATTPFSYSLNSKFSVKKNNKSVQKIDTCAKITYPDGSYQIDQIIYKCAINANDIGVYMNNRTQQSHAASSYYSYFSKPLAGIKQELGNRFTSMSLVFNSAAKFISFLNQNKTQILLTLLATQASLIEAQKPQTDEGLVAFLPFNANAFDESGNLHNGRVVGAWLTTDRFNRSNHAFAFNGIDSYIEGANGKHLPMAERSVSIWIKPESNSCAGIFGYGGAESICGQSWVMIQNPCDIATKSFEVQGHCNNNLVMYTTNENTTSTDTFGWTMLTYTTSQLNGTKIYVNATLAASDDAIFYNNTLPSAYFSVGSMGSPSGNVPFTFGCIGFFKGMIDDIVITNYAMTQDGIAYLYNWEPETKLTTSDNSYKKYYPGFIACAASSVVTLLATSYGLYRMNKRNKSTQLAANVDGPLSEMTHPSTGRRQ
jgi:hypothetical protein